MMNKIFLIIQREYLSRVRKKSFFLMTVLAPVIFAALIIVPSWLESTYNNNNKVIAINDMTGLYHNAFVSSKAIQYHFLSDDMANNKKAVIANKENDALLVIEGDLLKNTAQLQLYSDGQISQSVISNLKSQLNKYLRSKKLDSYKDDTVRKKIAEINNINVNINNIRLDKDGNKNQKSANSAILIGTVSAFLIYIFMLIYGTQVMRGVIEEKTNRIVELIISSVKPFQLMMGKIIGVGLVAITQFLIWITLTISFIFIANTFFMGGNASLTGIQSNLNNILSVVSGSNMTMLFCAFIFYFIGGYLIYSTLFATIGSVIDNTTETQQFVMPVMIPIILSVYVAMITVQNPNSDIAFWFSIIPLTSPVVMMARIPFDIPTWEIAISMITLVASFILFTWFASRVYRTGILMYGKKAGYKEIWKWFIQAGK